jgi:hypothetical protein
MIMRHVSVIEFNNQSRRGNKMHNSNEMQNLVMSHVNAMYHDAEQRRLVKMAKIEKQRGHYRRLALTVLRKLMPTAARNAQDNDANPIDTQTMRALRQH